eukprot:m.215049 g.215049  ORF g.215049 m.215049 type:complete len:103 (+) comp15874_c0_seq5:745-1053(+)
MQFLIFNSGTVASDIYTSSTDSEKTLIVTVCPVSRKWFPPLTVTFIIEAPPKPRHVMDTKMTCTKANFRLVSIVAKFYHTCNNKFKNYDEYQTWVQAHIHKH